MQQIDQEHCPICGTEFDNIVKEIQRTCEQFAWDGFLVKQYEEDPMDLVDELELEENLLFHLEEKGYVLLWSELFQDFVAFYMKSEVLNNIPDKYVTYSDQELKDLFSEGKSLSQKRLKFIHNIKKVFGSVILIDGNTPGHE